MITMVNDWRCCVYWMHPISQGINTCLNCNCFNPNTLCCLWFMIFLFISHCTCRPWTHFFFTLTLFFLMGSAGVGISQMRCIINSSRGALVVNWWDASCCIKAVDHSQKGSSGPLRALSGVEKADGSLRWNIIPKQQHD